MLGVIAVRFSVVPKKITINMLPLKSKTVPGFRMRLHLRYIVSVDQEIVCSLTTEHDATTRTPSGAILWAN